MLSAGCMPRLIFPPPVAESVGTAFGALSRGGKLTLAYQAVLEMHNCMTDVATCQIHSLFENVTYHNKPPRTEAVRTKTCFYIIYKYG